VNRCSCGYDDPTILQYSVAWYRAHMQHHLATFPDVDRGTRYALAMTLAYAETREAS